MHGDRKKWAITASLVSYTDNLMSEIIKYQNNHYRCSYFLEYRKFLKTGGRETKCNKSVLLQSSSCGRAVCAMSHNNIPAKLGIVQHRSEYPGKVSGKSMNRRLGGCWTCWSIFPKSARIFNDAFEYKVGTIRKYRELASVRVPWTATRK